MMRIQFLFFVVLIAFQLNAQEYEEHEDVQEKEMSAYLMVYHKDETSSLHMAISYDGFVFTALNNDKPVIWGDTIAEQRGIRDPHICRGPDKAFYMVMTDLYADGKEAGVRDTEYQRDKTIYGKMNNRAMVLMKSWDLIHWKHTNIRIDKLSKKLRNIGCVWAPEVIYDENTNKLMVYFTMRYKNEPNKIYYSYVNNDFDKIETLPKLLYEHHDKNVGVLDGDITKFGNKYYMFYAVNEGTGKGGIKRVVSDRINGGYKYDPHWYDYEGRIACEGPNVWKRIGENKWVLMYDVFQMKPSNFGFVETTDFKTFDYMGHFNEKRMKITNFVSPKHGAVIHLTKNELERLVQYYENK